MFGERRLLESTPPLLAGCGQLGEEIEIERGKERIGQNLMRRKRILYLSFSSDDSFISMGGG